MLFESPVRESVCATSPPGEAFSLTLCPVLAVVVPTYDERANIGVLIERLRAALGELPWELIVVDDDSPDETWAEVRRLSLIDPRIRCLHRIGRKGLASACMEGILASNAEFVAVIDADLQHDETLLALMLAAVRAGGADIAIGSRYLPGGSSSQGFGGFRQGLSDLGGQLARNMLGGVVSDPMSGFFLLRRADAERLAPRLNLDGFKILFEILVASRGGLTIVEIPYRFRPRLAGSSKLTPQTMLAFAGALAARASGNVVPARFFPFCLTGGLGLALHIAILTFVGAVLGAAFAIAQAAATWTAMAINFLVNNRLTFADRRLRGLKALRGFAMWSAICSIGALANVGIASSLYDDRYPALIAAVAGALITAAWNYSVSARLVWRIR